MEGASSRLAEWRRAERQRDALPVGSPEWQRADEEVRRARTVYHAQVARAGAYVTEVDFAERHHWWSLVHLDAPDEAPAGLPADGD